MNVRTYICVYILARYLVGVKIKLEIGKVINEMFLLPHVVYREGELK